MKASLVAVVLGMGLVFGGQASASAAVAACPVAGTSLYFGNGVNKTYDEAWEVAVDDLPGLAMEASVDDVVQIGVAYNHTDGLFADIIQTLQQKQQEDPRFGWFLLNNVAGYTARGLNVIGVLQLPPGATDLIAALQAVVNQGLLDSVSHPGTFYDADVADQVSGYEIDLVAGNRVVVIAHSQGTLYANAARAALSTSGAPIASFGIAAVADAAEVAFNGYVTSDDDVVINSLRTLGRTVLPANVHVPVSAGDFIGHGFEEIYINAQLPARPSVVALLAAVTKGLTLPPPSTSCPGGGTGNHAVAVSICATFACALTAAGGVECWGNNGWGNLGDGTMNARDMPVPVMGLQSGVKSVSVGESTACALTAAGGVECWGANGTIGRLGNGGTADSLVPVPVTGLTSGVTSLSVGYDSACAVTAGGSVMCWGSNHDGELGNNATTMTLVPVPVAGLSDATSVTVGSMNACAITASGAVACWGHPSVIVVATGMTATQALTPVQIPGLTSGATALAVGANSACAIVTGGVVKCWGSPRSGALGVTLPSGPPKDMLPVPVTALSGPALSISAGDNGTACAVLADGSVYCWGAGGAGERGDGTTDDVPTPVQVTGLSNGYAAVSVGSLFGCAVATAGGVECWGNINGGTLGNGKALGSLVPVAVAGFP